MRFVPQVCALFLATAFASSAAAQTLLTVEGSIERERYGTAIAELGDVNGDGRAELLISATESFFGTPGEGYVDVVSTLDGTVLYRVHGDVSGDFFGSSVASLGDLTGDGISDFAVGAPHNDAAGNNAGMVRVFSGADGAIIDTYLGEAIDGYFGVSMDAVGDLDNDGFTDLAVSEHGAAASGQVRVISGIDGSTIYRLETTVGDAIGMYEVSSLGDLTADGYDEIAAQVLWGFVVFSGRTGAEIRSVIFEKPGILDIAPAGDVDGDGVGDVVYAEFRDPIGAGGEVRVVSSATGSVIHALDPGFGTGFGAAVAGVGDLDGDGHDDFAVSALNSDLNGDNSGALYVFSGIDASVLYELLGDQARFFLGNEISPLSDVNFDGRADFAVAAESAELAGVPNAGAVRIYAGGPPVRLSPPFPGSVGIPNELAVEGLEPFNTALFFAKAKPGATAVACAGGTTLVNIKGAKHFATRQADVNGLVSLVQSPPQILLGVPLRIQVVESETCRISNLVLHEFTN